MGEGAGRGGSRRARVGLLARWHRTRGKIVCCPKACSFAIRWAQNPTPNMPPKKAAKRPASKDAFTVEVDSKLAAVDLLVAEMRSQLEAAMEPCLDEMRKEVGFFLMRLPSRVKGMRIIGPAWNKRSQKSAQAVPATNSVHNNKE